MSEFSSTPSRDDLPVLLSALMEGGLSDEQQTRLETLVAEDNQARTAYVDFMMLHAMLSATAAPAMPDVQEPSSRHANEAPAGAESVPGADSDPLAEATVPSEAPNDLVALERHHRWWTPVVDTINHNWTASMLVSGLFVTSIVLLLALWTLPALQNTISPEEAATTFVAKITDTHDASWDESSDGNFKNIDLFAGERLILNEGLAEITFADGAIVLLEGPVDFVVESAKRGRLAVGRLGARVPPEAVGFVVESPQTRLVDLGTEFGIRVDASGNEEVHVFKGRVECHWGHRSAGSDQSLELRGGESLVFVASSTHPTKQESSLAKFTMRVPLASLVPVARWSFSEQGVVEERSGTEGELVGNAKIVDDMLILDGGTSHAKLPDPRGVSTVDMGYTIMAWVRADEIRAQNIVVRTDEAGPTLRRSHELLMDAKGRFVHFIFTDQGGQWIVGATPAEPETWYHVAIVASQGDPLRLFVNGVEDARGKVPLGKPWTGGNQFHVGNGAHDRATVTPVEGLVGAVKDVRIFNVALSAEFVHESYLAAKDRFVPPIQKHEN